MSLSPPVPPPPLELTTNGTAADMLANFCIADKRRLCISLLKLAACVICFIYFKNKYLRRFCVSYILSLSNHLALDLLLISWIMLPFSNRTLQITARIIFQIPKCYRFTPLWNLKNVVDCSTKSNRMESTSKKAKCSAAGFFKRTFPKSLCLVLYSLSSVVCVSQPTNHSFIDFWQFERAFVAGRNNFKIVQVHITGISPLFYSKSIKLLIKHYITITQLYLLKWFTLPTDKKSTRIDDFKFASASFFGL